MHEDFPVQHNGIFKDRFVAANVGYFGVFDRQQSDLADALVRAVCDEPNFKYMVPNEQARVRFLTAFFGIAGRAGCSARWPTTPSSLARRRTPLRISWVAPHLPSLTGRPNTPP